MKTKLAVSSFLAAALAVTPLLAHHSFSAQFVGAKPIQLKGIVTRIELANPQLYFYIDVKGADGEIEDWGCETSGPGGLVSRGWKRDSLKVGDEVTVNGYRAGGTPGDGGPEDPAAKKPGA